MRRKINTSLIRFREQLGLTVSEFASILNISPCTLSEYEHGRRHIKISTYIKAKESAKEHQIDLPESLFFESEKKESPSIFKTNSLKEFRSLCGFNQYQMAEACGIHYRTWGRYERGETQPLAVTWFKMKEVARQYHIELQE